MTKPTIKASKQVLCNEQTKTATVIIQFELGYVAAGSALETAAIGAGYKLDGQNGDLRWYKSPTCKTAEEIDAVRNPIKSFFA